MNRSSALVAFFVMALVAAKAAQAQFGVPLAQGYGGYGGFGPGYGYGGYYGPYSRGYYGYRGYGPWGGYGNGGYGGYGGYGPFNYGQQLFQQQAALNQQIYQQQQGAIVGQIREAQGRLTNLDGIKQQLFQKYLGMSTADKAAVRSGLMADYLNLDAHGKEGWRRDGAIQAIMGSDLQRLDGAAQVRQMNEAERARYQQAMLDKYRSLSPAEQQAWRSDSIVGIVLGKDWWLK
ncbi:MAG TPA: hypothetical protein VGI40_24205 [Pirellulaceae bacterium]|jgi:hypothetical protein